MVDRTIPAALLMLVVAAAWLPAQQAPGGGDEESIATDRPDQTETSWVVDRGSLQWELGLLHERHESAGVESDASIAGLLLRGGLTPRVEARVIIEGGSVELPISSVEETDPAGDPGATSRRVEGLSTVAVGTKVGLLEPRGFLPEAALIAHVTLPLGREELRPGSLTPDFRFSFGHELGGGLSLGYNLGYEWEEGLDGGAAIYTFALGVDLLREVGIYGELFGTFGGDGENAHAADAGATFLLTRDTQLDFSVGMGLDGTSLKGYASIGVSSRMHDLW